MKKVILIGKKSFISQNLFFFLKKKFVIKVYDYEKFINLRKFNLKSDYLINCATNFNYINKSYNKKNDFDYQIALKIKNINTKFILLSSRKVYPINDNIKETNQLKPSSHYSKNKIITEKKVFNILKNKVLILRISNLIGREIENKANITKKRKIHMNFIDHFFFNVQKNIIFDNKKRYKDFLSVKKFSEIVYKLVQKNAFGVYNISIGKKVYLSKLIKWLNFYNKNKFQIKKLPNYYIRDSFYLNNNKLKNTIDIKINLKELEEYCKKLSKNFFKKIL